VREGEGVAVKVLESFGVSQDLVRAQIEADQALFEKVKETILDIRRLRQEAQASAQQLASGGQPPAAPPPQGPQP
jgi:hypothetical protein